MRFALFLKENVDASVLVTTTVFSMNTASILQFHIHAMPALALMMVIVTIQLAMPMDSVILQSFLLCHQTTKLMKPHPVQSILTAPTELFVA